MGATSGRRPKVLRMRLRPVNDLAMDDPHHRTLGALPRRRAAAYPKIGKPVSRPESRGALRRSGNAKGRQARRARAPATGPTAGRPAGRDIPERPARLELEQLT